VSVDLSPSANNIISVQFKRSGSTVETMADLYVEISADASPVIDVSRVRAGVFLLLGSRTDASSPFTSGNPGFGTFWDGTGTAPLLDAAARLGILRQVRLSSVRCSSGLSDSVLALDAE
jgi:hypothetical protein